MGLVIHTGLANASGTDVVTTTYGYDAFGSRVLQAAATTTNIYPFKWFSVASSTGSGAQYASTTEYVFSGDTLVSTIDQQLAAGVATGSPQTLYIHPDHLGSTDVVTNASGTVVETLSYYPYGSTRISESVGGANSQRKYIGLFKDTSDLIYANARYYNPTIGQFISQDPSFLALGDAALFRQVTGVSQEILLADPQLANSYSYARNNPITNKDPKGLLALKVGVAGTIPGWGLSGSAGVYIDQNGIDYYYGAGLETGGGAHFNAQLTTANLPHEYSISTSAFAAGGYVYGVELSKGMTYYPYSKRPPQPYSEGGIGIAPLELAAGGMAEVSGPIWQWNKPPVINSAMPKPVMGPVNFPNATPTQSTPRGGSSGSGGGTGFQRQVQIAALQLQVAQLQLQIIQLQTQSSSKR